MKTGLKDQNLDNGCMTGKRTMQVLGVRCDGRKSNSQAWEHVL